MTGNKIKKLQTSQIYTTYLVPFIYIIMYIVYDYIKIAKTTGNVTYEFIALCVNIVDYYYRGT